jgi:Carboxypeptidase regulatory-like domain
MRAFWVLLLAAGLGLAQQTGTRTVTGIITNSVTGEPIGRALVQVPRPGSPLSAFTGADGRFSLEGVPAQGPAFLSVQKPGFSGAQSPVVAGEMRVNLVPDGKISGHVLDPDGDPIERLPVQLLTGQIVQGRRTWQQRALTNTDEDGAYSFASLPAGRYLLRTLIHPFPGTDPSAPPLVYGPRYYPGAADLASAQAIAVTAGQDSTVELSLQPEYAFSVSGSLAGILPLDQLPAFSLTDGDGQTLALEPSGLHMGKFKLEHIPSGSWTVALGNLARQDFTVNGADVSGLQLVVQPLADIPVTVKRTTARFPQIQLIPLQSSNFFYSPQPQMPLPAAGVDIQMRFTNVAAGRYRLAVSVGGSECVASALSGSTDLTRDDLIVSPGSQPEPMSISIDSSCATLSGSVTASSGQSARGFAVAVPEAPQAGAKFTLLADAKFILTGLSPGAYRIYAFSDLDDLEYANREALREYRGQRVDLQAGQQATVTVEFNQREHK